MDSTSAMLGVTIAPAMQSAPISDEALAQPTNTTEHMAAALLATGKITRAELDAGMAAEPVGPFDDTEFGSIEPAFRPPPSPAEYRLPVAPEGVDWSIPLERGIRDAAHAAQLDQPMVEMLVSRGYAAATAPPKSDVQREMDRQNCRAELARAWGPDYEKNMRMTEQLVAGMIEKRPAIGTVLDRTGLGNDSVVIKQFFTRALARRKG